MDKQTLTVYERQATDFAARYRSLEPLELLQIAKGFFHTGGQTADIGTGSGRDAAWLEANGFPTVGYDAAAAMLREARSAYPNISFKQAILPELAEIEDERFDNVLCSSTLMHVPREHLITAAMNLARILKPEGRLIISYRSSSSNHEREADGRLFTETPPGKLILLLESCGLQTVQSLIQHDVCRKDVRWHVILAQKSPLAAARGLERVQAVLAQDKKDATYKFALIRAFCHISRTQANTVQWSNGAVYVPLYSVAMLWLQYYWPFFSQQRFIAQKRGERPGSLKPIAFRKFLEPLIEVWGNTGLHALLRQVEERPEEFRPVLRKIATTIQQGPVTYSGTSGGRLFAYVRRLPNGRRTSWDSFGWIVVPEPIWLDISRFNYWVEESLVLRWAQLTAEMNQHPDLNPGASAAEYLPLLLDQVADKHDTSLARELLISSGQSLECVWSGEPLRRDFEVDHLIPFSAWGNNDWWNLLPSSKTMNNLKRNALPTQQLLLRRRDMIIEYWRFYRSHLDGHFDHQVGRALAPIDGGVDWELAAFAGLQETVERVAATCGLARWEP